MISASSGSSSRSTSSVGPNSSIVCNACSSPILGSPPPPVPRMAQPRASERSAGSSSSRFMSERYPRAGVRAYMHGASKCTLLLLASTNAFLRPTAVAGCRFAGCDELVAEVGQDAAWLALARVAAAAAAGDQADDVVAAQRHARDLSEPRADRTTPAQHLDVVRRPVRAAVGAPRRIQVASPGDGEQ